MAVVNTHLTPVAGFITQRDFDFKQKLVEASIKKNVQDTDDFTNFTDMAELTVGDAIATNVMMLGYALQKGYLPVSAQAVIQAIELNGVAVDANKKALSLGRYLAWQPAQFKTLLKSDITQKPMTDMSLAEIIGTPSGAFSGLSK